ncbi:MAG TPA: hypothetical protein VGN78_00535 [Solirubrobacteraceae bacterium]|nr:hypothetical protein [Solirubrobacteraceae bacterium]
MYRPARERPQHDRRNGAVEAICVAIVVIAVAALVAWFVIHHGGGVLNQG